MITRTADPFTESIAQYLSDKMDRVFDEELQNTAKRVKARQSEIVSAVALSISSQIDIEREGSQIVIRKLTPNHLLA